MDLIWKDETMEIIELNDGLKMPQLGLGVFKVSDEEVKTAVEKALEVGYRAFDTAAYYCNEQSLGEVLRNSEIPREELFITSKVWNGDQGYDKTIKAFEKSLENLGTDYIDLYLVHWPCPDFDLYIDTFKALEQMQKEGKVKSIGVSNFHIKHLERLMKECEVKPVLNQVECHPYFQQKELKDFCEKHDIRIEAWAPLMQGGKPLEDQTIKAIGETHGKTAAQVIIRWHVQEGTIVIPKSVTPARIEENINIFDFELSKDEMNQIAQLDRGERKGTDPDNMYRTEIPK